MTSVTFPNTRAAIADIRPFATSYTKQGQEASQPQPIVLAILNALASCFPTHDYAKMLDAAVRESAWDGTSGEIDRHEIRPETTDRRDAFIALNDNYLPLLSHIRSHALTGLAAKIGLGLSGMAMLAGALATSQAALSIGVFGVGLSSAVLLGRLYMRGWYPHDTLAQRVLSATDLLESTLPKDSPPV